RERAHVLPCSRVPKLDVLVAAGGSDALAVGTERYAANIITMAGVRQKFVTIAQVPELHSAVAASGGELGAVRAVRDRVNFLAVSQRRVAENAADTRGQRGRDIRQLPGSRAKSLCCLQQPSPRQHLFAALSHLVGFFHQGRKEEFGGARFD